MFLGGEKLVVCMLFTSVSPNVHIVYNDSVVLPPMELFITF